MSPHVDALDTVPLSVYTPDPAAAHRAALYVCDRLDVDGAREVLQALGIVPYDSTRLPRSPLGKIRNRKGQQ